MSARRRDRTAAGQAGRGVSSPKTRNGPSDAATTRLSLYLRALTRCEAEGKKMASSDDLAQAAAVKPALVRKDLTRFGQFGIRGVGYEVDSLKAHIIRILGLDRDHNIVIVGAGNLGMALADSRGFNTGGFRTVALFDTDPSKVGDETRGRVPIFSMKGFGQFIRRRRVGIAVLAVPRDSAQRVLEQVAASGIRAVLNFAPATLKAPEGVATRNVDLKVHLEGLAYQLTRMAAEATRAAGRARPTTRKTASTT